MNDPILFENVHRHFGGVGVLRGLSFSVGPGEVYALLGRNGEGKTTALRILLGFLEPMRGRTEVLGFSSAELDARSRSRIGYVPEGQSSYESMGLSLSDFLDMESATREGFDRGYVEAALRRFELRSDQRVRKLSRGQRAQVALLMAMAVRPDVLVLDDPAMGLDAVVRRDFLNALIDYLVDAGCCVLLSSHVLPDVERLADRVGILSGGRLLVDATIDDLKRRVEKRWVVPQNGNARPEPLVPGTLRCRRQRNGFEVTLLDADEGRLKALRSQGYDPGSALPLSLEELFCDLTEYGPAGGSDVALRPFQESAQ